MVLSTFKCLIIYYENIECFFHFEYKIEWLGNIHDPASVVIRMECVGPMSNRNKVHLSARRSGQEYRSSLRQSTGTSFKLTFSTPCYKPRLSQRLRSSD